VEFPFFNRTSAVPPSLFRSFIFSAVPPSSNGKRKEKSIVDKAYLDQ